MRNNDFAVKRGRFNTDPGSPIHILYSPILQKDGSIVLEPSGKENTDDIINEQAKSCSLEALLTRYSNGDLSALNKYEGIYLDLTQYPETYAEAIQHMINAEYAFDRLPVDLKQKYGNNWRNWISKANTEEWLSDLGIVPQAEDVKEVVNSEQEQ